ncbi:tRNA (5-methylaminomethyl-2-thiouridine)(34)-methyltransferase MnmD [Kriegella aquimaris]|uniref:tRNA U34 5-methylaminomethyl-2-thiouridine-forming methyltransferase MnmC n=1 Tax=Kriegella aquimaris TaxID=192904 RepID=A0A1G9XJ61_9FLAO|nr:tRNA (5-methylaminomethyl-2-thiouridine)(34)-methyltransferase MnmD [Kriegella aquimaris]SDM96794.1 tRNA U34 5-methylaminomethyl-2-thiouridine-forming methyltransferase MnmC [Kriegella aquimaris]
MEREIITTGDGSKTIHIKEWNEQYHSKHGAIQEAYHVFVKHGLSLFENRDLSVLEVGFGTGLNAFITFLEARNNGLKVRYTGVELYPIEEAEIQALNYTAQLKVDNFADVFLKMHSSDWEREIKISDDFFLRKEQKDFKEINAENEFDLVYFDAFGARVQPEMWSEAIFLKMYQAMRKNGVLVTYAAKGSVRRAMQAVGFVVERLPGPPGKREMLRAKK